jgi:glycosyltransferase involved in cell wall biosynthesis
MNITNKFYDAIRNSKPVLSSQGGVVRELIETHKIGINYESDKPLDLLTNLKILINDKEQLLMFGKNSRKLYLESFDFNSVYEKLVRLLEALCSKK